MSDELVKGHVIAFLELLRDRGALIDTHTAQGLRVVDGILIDRQEWEIVDCFTGEVLVTGDGGRTRLKQLVSSPQSEDWVWLDDLTQGLRRVTTKSLPASLRTALDNWVGDPSVSDQEIAKLVGWTATEVTQARTG